MKPWILAVSMALLAGAGLHACASGGRDASSSATFDPAAVGGLDASNGTGGSCGNGVIDTGEECDWNPDTRENILPPDRDNCAKLDPTTIGELRCDGQCEIDVSYCQDAPVEDDTYGG